MSRKNAPADGVSDDRLFRTALADRWHGVPLAVQALHDGPDIARFTGRARVGCGWLLGIPMPRAFLPRSETREYVADGVFHFDVDLAAPLNGGRIVRYCGALTPVPENETAGVMA